MCIERNGRAEMRQTKPSTYVVAIKQLLLSEKEHCSSYFTRQSETLTSIHSYLPFLYVYL